MNLNEFLKLMGYWTSDHQNKHSEQELKEAFAVFDKVSYITTQWLAHYCRSDQLPLSIAFIYDIDYALTT